MKNYNGTILIIKEEKIIIFFFCLKLGSSCGDGEGFLLTVYRLNDKLLCEMLSKSNQKGALFLAH